MGQTSVAVREERVENQRQEFLIPEIRIEDIELWKVSTALSQNAPSLEELDKIGEKLNVSLTQMIIEERGKERW